jgi:NADPH2:quinone reductase
MVQVYAAPVNPSDVFFVVGQYGSIKHFTDLPVGTGLSGAGVIVDIGEGVPQDFIGKRVSISHMPSRPGFVGTFRKYTYIAAKTVYPFPESLSFDDIANCMGANPITIAGFMDTAEKDGHTVFINDAAASSLGKMFIRYCKKHNKTLINIVRRKDQADILKKVGAELILDSSDPDFITHLKAMIKEHKPTAYFDAISGEFPGSVLAYMPAGSTMYVYGALSNKTTVSIEGGGLIFKDHRVSNFWIPTWLKTCGKETLMKWMQEIVSDMMQGGEVFGTEVSKIFKLSEFKEALM